jgi:hypothetical protein
MNISGVKGKQGTTLGPNDFSFIDWSQVQSSIVSDYTVFGSTGCQAGYCNPIVGASDFGPYPGNMTRRGSFRQPGVYDVDLGVYKTFKLTERYSLQLRGEAYNLLNHSNLYVQLYDNELGAGTSCNPVTSTCTLGAIDAKRGSPAGAVALGNSGGYERRNLQLAAKFIF